MNKKRLIVSPEFKEFLSDNDDLSISEILYDLRINDGSTDKFNFLSPHGEDEIIVSPNSEDWDDKTFDWENRTIKNPIRIGRVISKLLRFNNYKIKDSEIETFVNRWKTYFNKENVRYEIVKGEDIRKWYSEENYLKVPGSQLEQSCMAYSKCSPFFDIYVENPKVCQMLILKDQNNKLLSRALLWTDHKGHKILDRIYYTNNKTLGLTKKWAKENISNVKIYDSDFTKYKSINSIIKLDKWKFKKYPYLDTFSYLNWQTGELNTSYQSHDTNKYPFLCLRTTNGEFDASGFKWVFSKMLNDFVDVAEVRWNGEDYIPLNKFDKIKRRIKKFLDL